MAKAVISIEDIPTGGYSFSVHYDDRLPDPDPRNQTPAEVLTSNITMYVKELQRSAEVFTNMCLANGWTFPEKKDGEHHDQSNNPG